MDFDLDLFDRLAQTICEIGRDMHFRGSTPATSSNFSARIGPTSCAITVSGRHKGRLSLADIMAIDLECNALTAGKPSAESLLHTQIYRRYPEVGAVLHTHPVSATVLSRMLADKHEIVVEGYELLKAFTGTITHETRLIFPIFENMQDIPALAAAVDKYLDTHPPVYGYLIRGHGVYVWGRDLEETHRHLEALDFLLSCEMEQMRIKNELHQSL